MPFVSRVVTPSGEAELRRLFPAVHFAGRSDTSKEFDHWLALLIARVTNELVGTDPLDVSDVIICETNRSTVMEVDLALIISARWSNQRAKARAAIQNQLKREVLGRGFRVSVEVHLVLIGARTQQRTPAQLATKCERINRALVKLAGGEEALACAPIEVEVVGISYQSDVQVLRELGLIETIRRGRGYGHTRVPNLIQINRGKLTPEELGQLLAEST